MAHYRTKYTYLSGYILHSYIYILFFCLISNTLQLNKRHLIQWSVEWRRGEEQKRGGRMRIEEKGRRKRRRGGCRVNPSNWEHQQVADIIIARFPLPVSSQHVGVSSLIWPRDTPTTGATVDNYFPVRRRVQSGCMWIQSLDWSTGFQWIQSLEFTGVQSMESSGSGHWNTVDPDTGWIHWNSVGPSAAKSHWRIDNFNSTSIPSSFYWLCLNSAISFFSLIFLIKPKSVVWLNLRLLTQHNIVLHEDTVTVL